MHTRGPPVLIWSVWTTNDCNRSPTCSEHRNGIASLKPGKFKTSPCSWENIGQQNIIELMFGSRWKNNSRLGCEWNTDKLRCGHHQSLLQLSSRIHTLASLKLDALYWNAQKVSLERHVHRLAKLPLPLDTIVAKPAAYTI